MNPKAGTAVGQSGWVVTSGDDTSLQPGTKVADVDVAARTVTLDKATSSAAFTVTDPSLNLTSAPFQFSVIGAAPEAATASSAFSRARASCNRATRSRGVYCGG